LKRVSVESTHKLGCHHPRNRMTEYSPSLEQGNGGDYWTPAFAGTTIERLAQLDRKTR
jgi:hypothetical protein